MLPIRQYHHHYHLSYSTTLKRHFSSVGVVIFILILILFFAFQFVAPQKTIDFTHISLLDIIFASFKTLFRLTSAYFLSLLVSIPLAIFITSTQKTERIFLPIFDIIQSIPVLAFFPIVVLVFITLNFTEGAAIFILFMDMVWSLVFSMIGGIKTVPQDILNAASIFGARGVKKLIYITLPSIFPYIITGSLLAWAQGWSILIVAEALHNYVPNGSPANDLFGLGTLLVNSFYQGKNSLFLASLATMIIIIALLNFFIWQKLLSSTERYKFD